ncbi:MAG TPA: DUF4157 domain-containing protein [Kofleriaceae bacterium]|nr:DUF4157 domain-containing protein [Kofleriaceae bacterium]
MSKEQRAGASSETTSTQAPTRRAPGHSSKTAGLAPSAGSAAPAEGPDPTAGLLHSFALPTPLRDRFEDSLGVDLGGVRLHTGDASATEANDLGARAFARGTDIHFGAGQYRPDDPFGQHLIAHEVAHTVQQGGGATMTQTKLATSTPGDAHEVEADVAADAMMAGGRAHVKAASTGPTIMRAPKDGSDAQSSPAPTEEEKRQARLALNRWKDQTTNYIGAVADYLSANWGHFHQKTGAPKGEEWTATMLRAAVSQASGFVLGKGGALAKAVLVATAGGPGAPIVGFLLEKLAGQIAEKITEGLAGKASTEEESSAKGADEAGAKINAKVSYFAAQRTAATKETQDVHASVAETLDASQKASQVQYIVNWANDELGKLGAFPLAGDLSLGQRMVKNWVLENTSTGDKAAAGINKGSWAAAKKSSVGEQDLQQLWIHQSRKEWRGLGLADVEGTCDRLLAQGMTGTLVFKIADAKVFASKLPVGKVSYNQIAHVSEGKPVSVLCEPMTEKNVGLGNEPSVFIRQWSYQLDFQGKTFEPDLSGGKAPSATPSFTRMGPAAQEPLIQL